jgi:hypothetical protein
MKASTAMDMIVASRSGRATQGSLNRRSGDFRDNYNRDSYLDEADMNS